MIPKTLAVGVQLNSNCLFGEMVSFITTSFRKVRRNLFRPKVVTLASLKRSGGGSEGISICPVESSL